MLAPPLTLTPKARFRTSTRSPDLDKMNWRVAGGRYSLDFAVKVALDKYLDQHSALASAAHPAPPSSQSEHPVVDKQS
jgi:hypothetical protein